MKIAVINETSAADKNRAIMAALTDRGHDIINAGMQEGRKEPELTYIHTGFLAALLLNTGRVDFVVGGCGTGQGFLNTVMQYPGIFCGHILNSLDSWLFAQINAGNCLSLALNQGYGWAADINLRFIFDRLFGVEAGAGYPEHRKESQRESRRILETLTLQTHAPLDEIVKNLPDAILQPALAFPGIQELLAVDQIVDAALKKALKTRMAEMKKGARV